MTLSGVVSNLRLIVTIFLTIILNTDCSVSVSQWEFILPTYLFWSLARIEHFILLARILCKILIIIRQLVYPLSNVKMYSIQSECQVQQMMQTYCKLCKQGTRHFNLGITQNYHHVQ